MCVREQNSKISLTASAACPGNKMSAGRHFTTAIFLLSRRNVPRHLVFVPLAQFPHQNL